MATIEVRIRTLAQLFDSLELMIHAPEDVRMLLGEWITTPVGQVVGEGLLILSWVVLWRPAELLLFERWESRHERQVLERLSNIPVVFSVSAVDQQ